MAWQEAFLHGLVRFEEWRDALSAQLRVWRRAGDTGVVVDLLPTPRHELDAAPTSALAEETEGSGRS